MKKNLFSLWLFLLAVFFTSNSSAQVTLGNTNGSPKAAETFSALEVVSNGKGGLRLPQLTTNQRNTLALDAISDPIKKGLSNGLSIYNTTTNCVEYWNSNRWISLCEGTSQTTISPQPCTNVAADGTGCDQTFTVTDPDCPNGPFAITIVGGSDYAMLSNVNANAGTFKVNFNQNDSVIPHTVLVRVTNSCTNQFKDFIFLQNGATCEALGTAPAISPSNSALSLCAGGAVYLSVDSNYPTLDKLIWTRNGIEVARGVNYYVATMKGTYNVFLGAVGCNGNAANERVITESGTAAPAAITTIISSNNGMICGSSGSITLTAIGASGGVSWFKNGILSSKTGAKITLTAADAGNWFAAAGSGGCYSKPSNTVSATVVTPSGTPITINTADVLVNNKPINNLTSFCSGGSLVLKVNNPQQGVSYTWYNDETIITSPYIIPAGQDSLLLRIVATDNSGAACPVEARSTEVPITAGNAPGSPTITGTGVICDGTADLTVVPNETGSFTYQWYKNGNLISSDTQTITVTEPGAVYSATVTNATGCVSAVATKTIANEVSSLPVLIWITTNTAANFGDKITYQVGIENGPATYSWSVDGGATYIGTGSTITVTFPSSGEKVNINVKATNYCGISEEITKEISLSSACPTPVVTAASPLTESTVAGYGIEVKVSVTHGNQQTYQWYSNTTASTTGGSIITGAISATLNFVPATAIPNTVYLYCIVTNGCQGTPQSASTPLFKVNVVVDPSTLDMGSGIFSGKTCFDINKSNFGGSCGTEISRTANMTDFKTQNVQNYIFTASATGVKKNLRFVIVDPLGAVQSTNADLVAISGNVNNNQVVALTVTYKNSLSDMSSIAYGKTTNQAVNVKIYAIYNDGNKDFSVPLNIKIQDCACCGAFVAAGVWKNFMCHNLGADTTLDPTKPVMGINGDYYQYGNKLPSANNTTLQKSLVKLPVGSNQWLGNTSKPKGDNDPCPTGYRVPTSAEWRGVIANNSFTQEGTWAASRTTSVPLTAAVKVGKQLVLPLAGNFATSTTALINRNYLGVYFVSDAVYASGTGNMSYIDYVNVGSDHPIGLVSMTNSDQALSVRCIEQ